MLKWINNIASLTKKSKISNVLPGTSDLDVVTLQNLNEIIQVACSDETTALTTGTDTVVDLYTPIVGVGTNINVAYDTDGTHINQTGQAVMGAAILSTLA